MSECHTYTFSFGLNLCHSLLKTTKTIFFPFSHQLLMNARSHTHAHSQRQKDYHHRYTEFYSLTHIHRYTMKLRVASSRIKQRQCLRIHTHLQNLLGKRNKRNEHNGHRIITMKPYRRREGRMKEYYGKKMKFSHDFVARTKKKEMQNNSFLFSPQEKDFCGQLFMELSKNEVYF